MPPAGYNCAMHRPLRTLAVIPAYNEAPRVAAVVAGASMHVDTVVVVDDGSNDATAEAAATAGAHVLQQPGNLGKGAALARGLGWAAERGCAAVVTLDGDGQHDPKEIPAFLEAWRQGEGDLIIGRRSFSTMPPPRRLANVAGRLLLGWALGEAVPDNQSGYRLLNRRALAAARPRRADFAAEVLMIADALAAGLALGWVPIRTIYIGAPSHFRPLGDSVAFLRLVVRLRRARVPRRR